VGAALFVVAGAVVVGAVATGVEVDAGVDDDDPEEEDQELAADVPTELEARTLAIVGGLMTVGVVAIEKIIRNIPIL
jgi:hypothetical protein